MSIRTKQVMQLVEGNGEEVLVSSLMIAEDEKDGLVQSTGMAAPVVLTRFKQYLKTAPVSFVYQCVTILTKGLT